MDQGGMDRFCRLTEQRSLDAERRIAPLRMAGLVAVGILAASCSTVDSTIDAINPFSRSRPDPASRAAAPVPGADQPYPNLADVPARPKPSPAAERRAAAAGLVADRDNAQYTDDVFRRNPAAPPPARAATASTVAAATPVVTGSSVAAPMASTPAPVMPAAPGIPSAPGAPQATITSAPLSAPPPPAATETARIAEPTRQQTPADAPLPANTPAAQPRGSTMDPIPGYLARRADPVASPRPVQSAPQPPRGDVPEAAPAPAGVAPPATPSFPESRTAQPRVTPRTLQGEEPGLPPPPPRGLGVPGGEGQAPQRQGEIPAARRMAMTLPSAAPPAASAAASPGAGRLDAMLQAEFPNVPASAPPMSQPVPTAAYQPPLAGGYQQAPALSYQATPARQDLMPGTAPLLRPPPGVVPYQGAGLRTAAYSPAIAGPRTALAATIYFGNGSWALDEDDRTILREIVRLTRERGARVRVVGHASAGGRAADPVARAAANLETSARRADIVAAELARQGLAYTAIDTSAAADSGSAAPVRGGGEAWDRRVEIYLDY